MNFSNLPEELKERFLQGTGWKASELEALNVDDLWKCKPELLSPEQTEWLYQLLFGIPLLIVRLKEAVSSSNCQVCGISGAWQEAVELITRYGHHEDPQLKGACSLLTEGYEHRARAILHARECLR